MGLRIRARARLDLWDHMLWCPGRSLLAIVNSMPTLSDSWRLPPSTWAVGGCREVPTGSSTGRGRQIPEGFSRGVQLPQKAWDKRCLGNQARRPRPQVWHWSLKGSLREEGLPPGLDPRGGTGLGSRQANPLLSLPGPTEQRCPAS